MGRNKDAENKMSRYKWGTYNSPSNISPNAFFQGPHIKYWVVGCSSLITRTSFISVVVSLIYRKWHRLSSDVWKGLQIYRTSWDDIPRWDQLPVIPLDGLPLKGPESAGNWYLRVTTWYYRYCNQPRRLTSPGEVGNDYYPRSEPVFVFGRLKIASSAIGSFIIE